MKHSFNGLLPWLQFPTLSDIEFDCMLICSSTGLPSSQDVENWFKTTYKRSPSKSVTKESVFLNACRYFNRVANKKHCVALFLKFLADMFLMCIETFKV